MEVVNHGAVELALVQEQGHNFPPLPKLRFDGNEQRSVQISPAASADRDEGAANGQVAHTSIYYRDHLLVQGCVCAHLCM